MTSRPSSGWRRAEDSACAQHATCPHPRPQLREQDRATEDRASGRWAPNARTAQPWAVSSARERGGGARLSQASSRPRGSPRPPQGGHARKPRPQQRDGVRHPRPAYRWGPACPMRVTSRKRAQRVTNPPDASRQEEAETAPPPPTCSARRSWVSGNVAGESPRSLGRLRGCPGVPRCPPAVPRRPPHWAVLAC